jgi:hypothetical protein
VGLEIANLSDATWDDLHPNTQRYFNIAGLSPTDWDEIRAVKWQANSKGVKVASPWQLNKAGRPDLARKLNAFFQLGQEIGVPTNGVAKQIYLKQKLKNASPLEAAWWQSIFTFKGFTSSVWENHMRTAIRAGDSRAVYAQTLGGLFILGIGQEVLENAFEGRTTNMKDPKTYMEAFIKGGGLSVFGDFISPAWRDWQTLDRLSSSLSTGVVLGTLQDFGQALFKAGKEASKGGDTKLAYDLFKIANGYNPLATTWYTKGLFEEHAAKYIRQLLSPRDERRREQRIKRRMRKEGTRPLFDN